MASTDYLPGFEQHEKYNTTSTVNPLGHATLLKGHPIISNIATWCHKHNKRRRGVKPTLAVVYFNTGEDAEEYLYVKAVVAARAAVSYTTHVLPPKAPLSSVLSQISKLNNFNSTHGILVQRPIPPHLSESAVMNSISPSKHIEEFMNNKPNNIALDSLERLLSYYHQSKLLDLHAILLGGTNIITPAFVAQLEQRHHKSPTLLSQSSDAMSASSTKATIVLTELNQDSIITPKMLGPNVKLVVDLGFDVETKQGDLNPDVLDMEGLKVVPTPGGVLPVLLWVMMERTIRARDRLVRDEELGKTTGCCIVS